MGTNLESEFPLYLTDDDSKTIHTISTRKWRDSSAALANALTRAGSNAATLSWKPRARALQGDSVADGHSTAHSAASSFLSANPTE